jgi:hypothetical protein
VVLDCSHHANDQIHILDWKTGKGSAEDNTVQLACYGFYALEKWHIEANDLKVIEFNLTHNRITEFGISKIEIDNIKEYIRGSVSDMRSMLADPENNTPKDEGFFVKTDDVRVCRRCNFQKVCLV